MIEWCRVAVSKYNDCINIKQLDYNLNSKTFFRDYGYFNVPFSKDFS